jgi:RNase adaptor protein for sRNA GlmZ degradation
MHPSSLHIRIYSFGFHKSAPPQDDLGHGGGFVFDCRGLANPGREEDFRSLTGLDEPVQTYLEGTAAVEPFLAAAEQLVLSHAQSFLNRGFTDMMISFGCTGGQHRSVYCAEQLSRRLTRRGFTTEVHHIDMPQSGGRALL